MLFRSESFEKVLTKAQTLGQTATKVDSKKQAFFIISSIEGSISSAKAVNDFVVLEDSLAILTNYIKKL